MNMWENCDCAAGPEVVGDHGAPEPDQPSAPESLQAPPRVALEHARQALTCQVSTPAVGP
jgi:hypothetical protein